MNTKAYSEAIQARAMQLVEIRPLSDTAAKLIDTAVTEHGFPSRADAFNYLRITGQIDGVDVGGELLNHDTAVDTIVSEFGCQPHTARKHVARAARRKRHPGWRPPQWGGAREGAGRPHNHVIDVRNGRAIVARRERDGALSYLPATNWQELEAEAAESVAQQGGALNMSGQYQCPPELAERGAWDDV